MSGWLFTYAPLVALCVSILALSASFLSLGWNIYRDVVLKPRLKVSFGIKSMLREDEKHRLSEMGPPLLILEITNHGPGEVACSGAVAKTESFAFLRSLFGKLSYRSITPDFKHPLCFRLPYRIAVGEKIQIIFPYNQECFLAEAPTRIGINDSFDRTRWASRQELKRAIQQYRNGFWDRKNSSPMMRSKVFYSRAQPNAFRRRDVRQAIQIVRPLESIAETQPQLQPAFLRLSAMIS